MAKIYTSGLVVRFVRGRIDGTLINPANPYTPFKNLTDPKFEFEYSRPFQFLGHMSETEKKEVVKAWLWAHPEWESASEQARTFRTKIDKYQKKVRTATFAGPKPLTAKLFSMPKVKGSIKPRGMLGPGGKAIAHEKKESYPPTTDPSKPWWTSPPTFRAECHAQRIADITYQGFTDEIRLEWRKACTPKYQTPYDVYQHQAIPRLVRGIPVSPIPPPQAGWLIRRLEQNVDYWHDQTPEKHWAYPDASCQTWGLAMGHVRFAIRHRWDGFKWNEEPSTLWSLYADVGLGNERDKGFITPTIYAGHHADGPSHTFHRMLWPEMTANPIVWPLKAHSASFLWEPRERDGSGTLIVPGRPDIAKGITVKTIPTDWTWFHYRLPYPSKKCTPANMIPWIKSWPDPTPTEWYEPYF